MTPDAHLSGGAKEGASWGFPRWLPVLTLLGVRLLSLGALPFEALVGCGDYAHFFSLAQFALGGGGGLPFIGHWVEFPPMFPFLSLGIYRLSGGQFHSYAYLLALLMMAFDLANLLILARLARRYLSEPWAKLAVWPYLAFLALPAFGWWTFEPMAVFWMLLALLAITEKKPIGAGLAAGLGFLTKLFPVVVLPVAWVMWPWRRALLATAVAVAIAALVLGPLFLVNPEMTGASLRSQFSKGSWETVWALLDGNLVTGLFGAIEERVDPSLALQPRGQPAVVPHWIPTLAAALIALVAYRKARGKGEQAAPIFLVLLFSVLLLWSRGWSPQWLAYFFPILLLSFPPARSIGLGFGLAFIALLEWPVLLTRNRFDLLWLPVVARTMLLIVIAIEAGRILFRPTMPRGVGEAS